MNGSDLPRIVKQVFASASELDRIGAPLLASTKDWQSPLRSASAKGPKGQHADPTSATAIDPDPLALEHDALVDDVVALYLASVNLQARLRRLEPIKSRDVPRGRVNSVPTCIICHGPAPRCRRGFCDACYTAWIRAERPEVHLFRKRRLEALAPPVARSRRPDGFPQGNTALCGLSRGSLHDI